MPFEIAMLEGYQVPGRGKKPKRRGHRKGGNPGQKARFAKASKKCKGQSQGAFRACMRDELKK